MISREQKLSAAEVRRVFASSSTSFSTPLFTCITLSSQEESKPRFAVVVPRSVTKSAVERNTIRRKVFSALREYLDISPGLYVIVVKKDIINASLPALNSLLKKLYSVKKQ